MEKKEINFMLVQKDCENCKKAEVMLKDAIADGRIKPLDASTPEGLRLAEKHNIEAVPTIINKKDKFEQVCYLSKDAKKIYCNDGSEKVI